MMMGKYDDDLTADHCLPSVAELMVTGFGKGKGEAQIETYKLKNLQIEISTLFGGQTCSSEKQDDAVHLLIQHCKRKKRP